MTDVEFSQKTGSIGLSENESSPTICLAVLTQYEHVTDRQTIPISFIHECGCATKRSKNFLIMFCVRPIVTGFFRL